MSGRAKAREGERANVYTRRKSKRDFKYLSMCGACALTHSHKTTLLQNRRVILMVMRLMFKATTKAKLKPK